MQMRPHKNLMLGIGLLGWCGAVGLATHVTAAPVGSPSVRHAARLKYAPPPNWIRHYLGDDRFKIDGNIWRVVSTQMDTYYHRPNCPNMMRQPNDIAIGFPSGQDALEAGYNPDSLCRPEVPVVEYANPAMPSPSGGAGSRVSTVAQTITLSDGSSITVPAGWQRVASMSRDNQGMKFSVDAFRTARRPGTVAVSTMTFARLPANVDLASFLTPDRFRASFQGNQSLFNTTGVVSSNLDNAAGVLNNLSVGAANFGGMRGVSLRPKRGARIPGMKGSLYMVGRGQKLYMIQDETGGGPGVNTFLRSFRPR